MPFVSIQSVMAATSASVSALVASVIFDFGNAAQIVCTGNLHINVLVEEQTERDVVDKLLDRVFLKQDVTVRCRLVDLYRTDCNCVGHLSDTVLR